MPLKFKREGCVLKVSEDDGVTWPHEIDLTPCIETVIHGEPGIDLRCRIATYLTDHVKRVQDVAIQDSYRNAAIASSSATIVGLFALIGGPAAPILAAITAAAAALRAAIDFVTAQAYETALDVNFYNYIRCQLFCILDDNANISDIVIDEWVRVIRTYNQANLAEEQVANFIAGVPLDAWRGLASFGSLVPATGICDSCDICNECQLLSDDDETPAPVSNPDGSLTLASSVYNAELRSYVGNYALLYQTKCCKLTFDLNDSNYVFEYPQEPVIVPGMFITYQPCGPANTPYVLLRQPEQTLADFNNVCFNNFQLRSEVPFNVKVRMVDCGAEEQAIVDFASASSTIGESGGSLTIQVVLSLTSGTLQSAVTVPITVSASSTASSSDDYTLQTASVTFPVGSANGATQPVTININDDAITEGNETIVLQLGTISGPGTPGAVAQHTVTITSQQCVEFPVPATAGATGYASGVIVEVNDTIEFTATSTWTWGTTGNQTVDADGVLGSTFPTAVAPSIHLYCLIAKIGNGNWFFVGTSKTITATEAGEIYLTMNDGVEYFGDNSGSLNVKICVS